MAKKNKNPWYVAGLHFECMECGNCCSGPGEGYIWITRPETELLADFFEMSKKELRQRYLKRSGLRTTITEHPLTKDCTFLQKIEGKKRCVIYPVRPNQCRTWPFWSSNLACTNAWSQAGKKCIGVNYGKHHSADEINKIKNAKKWWQDDK